MHACCPGPPFPQRLKGEVDIDNYENVPVPRPKLPSEEED